MAYTTSNPLFFGVITIMYQYHVSKKKQNGRTYTKDKINKCKPVHKIRSLHDYALPRLPTNYIPEIFLYTLHSNQKAIC